jgi:DNA polymerase elongation subunit (family B)
MIFLEERWRRENKKKYNMKRKYRYDLEVRGRVNINLYRICEAQLKLKSYTIANICYHLFN